MAWVAEHHLAAAVSEAGGLGLIGGANAPGEVVREEIRKAKALTKKPFGVNVMLMSPYADDVAKDNRIFDSQHFCNSCLHFYCSHFLKSICRVLPGIIFISVKRVIDAFLLWFIRFDYSSTPLSFKYFITSPTVARF